MLKLAAEDASLIYEMKLAIKELFAQAQNREMVYLSIEHNCKYLAVLADHADSERVLAVNEQQKMQDDLKRYKLENEEMSKRMKVLEKDSQALVVERMRTTKLQTDYTNTKESEMELTTVLKDFSRRLKTAESDLIVVTAARDEFKEKSEELETSLAKTKVDLKEFTHKEVLASETCTDLAGQNAKYRALFTTHEQKLTDKRVDITDLKKKVEILKDGTERLSEENASYKKQNANLVQQLKETKESEEEEFVIE